MGGRQARLRRPSSSSPSQGGAGLRRFHDDALGLGDGLAPLPDATLRREPAGVLEIVGVTQMFSSYTKIADTLQLEPDMADIAPIDPTPAPGGQPAVVRSPAGPHRRDDDDDG